MTIGKFAQFILQFISLFLLVRLLKPEDFGIVSAAGVVISLAKIFSLIGVGPVLIQRPHITKSHIKTGFTITLIFSVACASIIFFMSDFIADLLNIKETSLVLKLITIIFIAKGFSTISESLIQRDMNFKIIIKIDIITFILYSSSAILLALLHFNYWALVLALIIQNVLKAILLYIYKPYPLKFQINKKEFKEFIFFGGGFTISKTANQLAKELDKLVVSRSFGAYTLGQYDRAYQLLVAPANLFTKIIDAVLFPAISKMQTQKEKIAYIYEMNLSLISFLTIPSSILMYYLAEEIVYAIYGSNWISIVPIFKILIIGLMFRTSYIISDSYIQALGLVYQYSVIKIIYAFLILVGAWYGKNWGIEGVSIGVLLGILINYLLMTILTIKNLKISIKKLILAHKPVFYAILMAFLSIIIMEKITSFLNLLFMIEILFTFGIYIIFLLLLYLFNSEKFYGEHFLWIKNQMMIPLRNFINK